MANQTEDPPVPTAQIIGNAFIQQYYLALHKSPDVVHKFYCDSSVLSRPGTDGMMTSVTTMQGINEMILSLDYQNYHAHILTADAQFSYKDGVIVLVTGCLIGNSNVRRKFTQSFFLAPQDKGYFVLNDVFRYVDDVESNDADVGSPTLPLTKNIESDDVPEQPVIDQTASVEVEIKDNSDVIHTLENGKDSVPENNAIVDKTDDNTIVVEKNVYAEDHVETSISADHSVSEAPTTNLQEDADAPKKSFASIVHALNKNTAPFHMRTTPPKHVEQPRKPAAAAAVPEAPTPIGSNTVERNIDHAAKAYAIFVANLPMTATVEELDKLFKQFGLIKADGIQVRSNKQQGTCFGFVEFESASSMQSAIEASPIMFGSRKLSIEERRANNDRARFPAGRSGYRNDNFRGRGNYHGGRGYGRNDYEKRGEFSSRAGGEFSGRARGNAGRSGERGDEGYHQRSYPNDEGKVARQSVKVA